MSHHIYTTPGFIVHSQPQGESSKFFLVFTHDLGMLGATAQGVRLSQSKLRYYLQDFSFSLFSLVRGKEVWRITGAKELESVDEIKEENKKLYVQILNLLKRLLPGEEKNEELFDIMTNFYNFLTKEIKERELVEYATVFRILYSLGYISNINNLLVGFYLNESILREVQENKDFIIKEINNGLKQSQL